MFFSQLTLWTWLLHFVLPQVPLGSLTLPDQFGNCDPIDETILETGYPGGRGLVAMTLHAVYTPSSSIFPRITVTSFRILCESRSPMSKKVSSTTVIVEYSCTGSSSCFSLNNNRHIMSFFCSSDNDRFTLQSSVVNGFSNIFGSVSANYGEVEEYGACTLCGMDAARIRNNPLIRDRFNQKAGCVRCLSQCDGSCTTSLGVEDERVCCPALYENGMCVLDCPLPYFNVFNPITKSCIQLVILEDQSSNSDTNLICEDEVLEYNCETVYTPSSTGSLVWEVTLPEQTTVVITYTNDELLDALRLFSHNIAAILREFTVGQYIRSTLTITASLSQQLFGAEVQCSAGGLSPASIDVQHTVLQQAPLKPIGFRISKRHVISDERAVITLVWFTQGVDESLPQSFELTVTPQPLVPFGNIISSPFNVTVSPQYPYRASLTAVNCIGRSKTIILVIDAVRSGAFIEVDNVDRTDEELTVSHGDSAPTITCLTSTNVYTNRGWQYRGANLPFGITERFESMTEKQRLDLQWSRPMEFTDSGQYQCTYSNAEVEAESTLNIAVTRSPVIITSFPVHAFFYGFDATIPVPVGFTGVIFSCNVIGWPPPSVAWSSQASSTQVYSHTTTAENSAYILATLKFPGGFQEQDSGIYTCVVEINGEIRDSKFVRLVRNNTQDIIVATIPLLVCESVLDPVIFQVRVLTSKCSEWEDDRAQLIASSFVYAVKSAIYSLCQDCAIPDDTLAVFGPLCSSFVEGAALFRGTITTTNDNKSSSILCALNRWIQSKPTIFLDQEIHRIDESCPIILESLVTSRECKPILGNPMLLIATSSAAGGVILIILIVISVIFISVMLRDTCKKKGRTLEDVLADLDKEIPNAARRQCEDDDDDDDDVSIAAPTMVISQYQAKFHADDDESVAAPTMAVSAFQRHNQDDDYTTQQDDYTTQQSDYITQQGDYTTKQSDYTTQQSDYTTQQGDYTTQQGDYTTQQSDYTTQQGDYKTIQDDYTTQQSDYTTQHDYKTIQDDYTTQQSDYTTQQSDYTTQQGDYTTQQSDYTTQQGDYTTQQSDYTTQQGDYTTQQSDYTTQYDDYTTQQGDNATRRTSYDRSSKKKEKIKSNTPRSLRKSQKRNMNKSDNTSTHQGEDEDYKTLRDDHTTQQGDDDFKTLHDDYTTQQDDFTTQCDDYTTQQGTLLQPDEKKSTSQQSGDRSSQRGDQSSRRKRRKTDQQGAEPRDHSPHRSSSRRGRKKDDTSGSDNSSTRSPKRDKSDDDYII